MPGPKMGPRPVDFDEDGIKNSPTYIKWLGLKHGEKLRYACREFIKGNENDDERLMRRIMIARRNNCKDHEVLKKARKINKNSGGIYTPNLIIATTNINNNTNSTNTNTSNRKRSIPNNIINDAQVEKEMDKDAVEKTRSYKAWIELPDGSEFIYNQKYIKGREGHDWLLRKNIWRRMRYRRENKKMVETLREQGSLSFNNNNNHNNHNNNNHGSNNNMTTSADAAAAALAKDLPLTADQAAIQAAVAAAESFGKIEEEQQVKDEEEENDNAAAQAAALDAAAQLAAATAATTNAVAQAEAAAATAAAMTASVVVDVVDNDNNTTTNSMIVKDENNIFTTNTITLNNNENDDIKEENVETAEV